MPPPERTGPRRPFYRRAGAGLAAVYALHLGLLLHFAPPGVMLGSDPVQQVDYSLHYYQADRARQAFAGWGRLWGYDPLLLAGQPAGTILDTSSKATNLAVIGLSALGVAPGLAFNLYLLLVHLLMPLVGYAAARLFGLAPGRAVVAALLWVLLWFLDSFMHWIWFCGMISWTAASYLLVLLVGLVHRACETGRTRAWVPVAAVAALLTLIHPFGALAAVIPCAALYLRAARSLRPPQHLAVLASLAAAAAVSLVWLLPALRFSHYLLHNETFLKPGPAYLLFDYLDLMRDPLETGVPVRTMLRVVVFAAAAVLLWRWWRARDRRLLPLGLLVGVGLTVAYLGGAVWLVRQSQPYRQIAPATLAAALPAALLLGDLLSPRHLRSLPRGAALLLAVAALALLPRLARTVLYYLPGAIPMHVPERYADRGLNPSPLMSLYDRQPYPMRNQPAPRAHVEVSAWLRRNHEGRGRVLVQDWTMGEFLAWQSGLPILGGFPDRNVAHVDANLFARYRDRPVPKKVLTRYLRRYAVGWVVMTAIKRDIEWRRDLLTFRVLIRGHRIYEVTPEPSYFAMGEGEVAAQGFNRIRLEKVTPAAEGLVVLRFHWMETLRCRPGCTVERARVPGDRVGFIRVPNPPPAFEIYQDYARH